MKVKHRRFRFAPLLTAVMLLVPLLTACGLGIGADSDKYDGLSAYQKLRV